VYTPAALMRGVARALVRYRATVLGLAALATLFLGTRAAHVRVEGGLENLLPAGDPEVAYYAEVRQVFGSDDVGVVGVRADDVLAPATLEKIARVTDALARIEGVERVLSLTNAVDPAADVFAPPPLLPHVPPSPEEIAALRQKLSTTPLYRKNLVAEDFRGAAINVFFKPLTDAQYADLGIDARIAAVLATAGGPERFYYTGAAHVKQAAVTLMRRDLVRFTPWALAVVVVVLGLSFRTKRGVLLPLLAVLVALLWTLGILVLAGRAITIGTFVLPPLLLVVGSSYAIHVMARYYEQVDAGVARTELVVRAFERVGLPLAVSALITAIGFGALMVNRIPAIWELGCFAVVGVLCLLVTCLLVLPAALASLPPERRGPRAEPRPVVRWLAALGRVVYGSRRAVFAIAGGLAGLALLGAWRIRVDADFLQAFSPRSEVRQANEIINREIVGSNPFYIVVEGGEPGLLRRWEVLKAIRDLERFIETLPGITSSISLVDYLELLESGLSRAGAGDLVVDDQGHLVPAPTPPSFWEDPRGLEPLLAMVTASPATFRAVVTPDFRRANILVRTSLSGSRRIEDTLARIRAYIAEHFPARIPVRLTGSLVLLTGTTSDIVAGQIESLALALGAIFAVMALMFLSVKIGAVAILPNVLPIVIFFGVMGWLGIQLNFGTSLIAAISLGLAVDATVHYMARFNLELKGETDQLAAIRRALETVGVPIVFTTAALCLGFLVFALSSFVPIQDFGVLAGVTMAAALGTNLVVLPALLATTKIITLWDLLTVKLGRDPTRTIPLFAGLRPSQARVVVLMGKVRRFAPGETIIRQGEPSDAMHMIIDGTAEVWLRDGAVRRRIAEHHRGDVIGEMGLVRRGRRSADVVAADEVEVLTVDETFLRRIQRRYPRIAVRVFLNLTRILADRLEESNRRLLVADAAEHPA
jgi:predicted RND superfamily exporter protein